MRAPATERPPTVPNAPPRLSAPVLDIVIGAILVAMAVWLWIQVGAIDSRSTGLMGPTSFPHAIAVLLGGSALILMLRAARALGPGRRASFVTVRRPSAVVCAIAMSVIYPLLVGALGYYIATALWLPPLLWIAGYRRPLGVLACSAGFLVFTWVVFQHVLGTPMP